MKKKSLFVFILSFGLYFGITSDSFAIIYQVTTTAFSGVGSIETAVNNANASAGKDTIYFSIPGAGPHTILLGGALTFTQDIHINGTTQTGYNPLLPKPVIELRNSGAMGININGTGAQRSEIIGLAINNCAAMGILLNAPNNTVQGCYIGLALDGVTDNGNSASGIEFSAVAVSGNIIGGTTSAQRNVISGNSGHGINVTASSGNYFIGNYIGTNATATAAVGNGANGIQLSNNCTNNRIGGTSLDSVNIIGGNNHGIELNASPNNIIRGNIIGLQADRTSVLGNLGHGILIINNSNNTMIGGSGLASGNLISSNGSLGINVFGSSNTIIKSNIIGTSGSSTLARGNNSHGIQLENAPFTVIGGVHATEGNIISGATGGAGINFEGAGSKKTIIKGNYIGTDNSATIALGNFVIGIILKSDSCIIGGVPNGEGNVIADTKLFCGLLIANANATVVQGNFIGVGPDGTTQFPNKTDGINISVENAGQSASNNIIQFNTIAYNTAHGINVGNALNNFVSSNEHNNDLRFNSIYCNQQLGISLTLTNPATQGNFGKTAPAINNALSTTNKVVGLANGLLSTDAVDIFEMSECINCDQNPQGKRYITTVFPDASGNWNFDNGSPITGTIIAMATDVLRNSSQFSLCFTPCSATATANPTEYTAMMEMNTPVSITLNSSSVFSTLNPDPGKIYWSMGTADTTAASVLSTSAALTLNFATASNGTNYGPGLYNIYLIAAQSGCLDTTRVTLNLFFVPNMITPNGDLHNDQWAVGNAPGQFDAKIYNRWGDLVYSKSDYTNEWDGTGLSDGVYYYQLEDKVLSGKSYKGWIQIVK